VFSCAIFDLASKQGGKDLFDTIGLGINLFYFRPVGSLR
jgi:hypothetical protein